MGHVDRIKWHQRPLGNYERALAPSLKQERILLGDSFPWSSSKQHKFSWFQTDLSPIASSRGGVDRIKWHQRPLGNYKRALAPSLKKERILLGYSFPWSSSKQYKISTNIICFFPALSPIRELHGACRSDQMASAALGEL